MSRIFKMTFFQLKKCGIIFSFISVLLGTLPGFILTGNKGNLEMHFHVISYFTFIVMAPVIAILCFNFLNKRNSSDYYHSMAATRKELYFGRLLAGITWQLIFVVISLACAIASYNFLAVDIIVNYSLLIRFFVAILIVSILIIAAISLAMSLTTGAYYNIISSLIIIFFTRMISEFTINVITGMNHRIVDYNNVAGIFDKKYNMLMGLISLLSDDNIFWKSQLNLTAAYVYTAIITIGLILLGMWAFCARRSEIAQARNPKKVENAMKVVAAIGVFIICAYVRFSAEPHAFPVGGFILGICLAIILMVAWDYILTKNKHIASSIVAIAVCVLIIGIVGVNDRRIADFKPVAENIDSIEISVNEDLWGSSYFQRVLLDGVKTNDENTIKFFSDNYDKQLLLDTDIMDEESHLIKKTFINVKFIDGLNQVSVKRSVAVTDEFCNIIYNDKNISEALYSTLPDVAEINYVESGIKTEERQKEFGDFYSKLKADIEKYRPKEFVEALFGNYRSNHILILVGEFEVLELPILESMPESFESYNKLWK